MSTRYWLLMLKHRIEIVAACLDGPDAVALLTQPIQGVLQQTSGTTWIEEVLHEEFLLCDSDSGQPTGQDRAVDFTVRRSDGEPMRVLVEIEKFWEEMQSEEYPTERFREMLEAGQS